MDPAKVEKSSTGQCHSQARGRCLRVFLPWSPLFTPLTGTDVRLRDTQSGELHTGANGSSAQETDSLDPNILLPLAVNLTGTHPLPLWQRLPVNPLCTFKPILPSNRLQGGISSGAANASQSFLQPPSNHPPETSSPSFHQGELVSKSKRGLPEKEDFLYYCDACQKGFKLQEKYDAHMENHIYCNVPGCGFTCRKDRGWKMEEHVNMLHNRPNAPDLVDNTRYLDQRRSRFPTQDAIKQKVEELYYKAARGAVLPNERRRWMQQHGVHIQKRFRSEHTYIQRGKPPWGINEDEQPHPVRDANDDEQANAGVATGGGSPEEKEPDPALPICPSSPHTNSSHRARSGDANRSTSPVSFCQALSENGSSSDHSTRSSLRRAGEINPTEAHPPAAPLSGDGDNQKASCAVPPPLFHHQSKLIQRVERQRENGQVPRYYVCNRCGVKGSHWLSDCPTKGNPLYNRHMVWGEPKLSKPDAGTSPALNSANPFANAKGEVPPGLGSSPAEEPPQVGEEGADAKGDFQTADDSPSLRPGAAPIPRSVAHGDSLRDTNRGFEDEAEFDALPPPEVTARAGPTPVERCQAKKSGKFGPNDDGAATKDVSRMLAPVAAKKFLQARMQDKERKGRGKPSDLRERETSKEPTLYERLTEEDRLNEKGLLLQAIRFFVARDFFC
ncbi:unnamed protein product [Phytomonas sp. Hart1]|nr:unnamed protein product [Phytomonas sp. Hart1]|eukprot:CCW67435.1 unnamed protein product [Phytomonas sp. isolate Hart1]